MRGLAATASRVGYDARQHADAITAGLAIQAAGRLPVPVARGPQQASSLACSAWVGAVTTGEEQHTEIERVELPPVSSSLEVSEPRQLVLDEMPKPGMIASRDLAVPSPESYMQAARRLDRSLASASRRDIVCAAPELDPGITQLLVAWTLARDAAWVLEPETEAFIETVLWARPTVIWARVVELEQLAARLKARKHRRRSRLRSVVVADGEDTAPGLGKMLGADVVSLGGDALAVARR